MREGMRKILVVDDEFEIVRLLEEYLSDKGYCVVTAIDGMEAVRHAGSQQPDGVLLDLIMPGLDGIEALKEIKRLSPRSAVIIISAVIHENIIQSAFDAGADKYFFKPFSLDALEKNMSNLIDLKEKEPKGVN